MSIQLPGNICAPKKVGKFVVHCWKSAPNTTEDQKSSTFFACGGQFSTILYSYLGKFVPPRKIEKLCYITIAEKVPQIWPKIKNPQKFSPAASSMSIQLPGKICAPRKIKKIVLHTVFKIYCSYICLIAGNCWEVSGSNPLCPRPQIF